MCLRWRVFCLIKHGVIHRLLNLISCEISVIKVKYKKPLGHEEWKMNSYETTTAWIRMAELKKMLTDICNKRAEVVFQRSRTTVMAYLLSISRHWSVYTAHTRCVSYTDNSIVTMLILAVFDVAYNLIVLNTKLFIVIYIYIHTHTHIYLHAHAHIEDYWPPWCLR